MIHFPVKQGSEEWHELRKGIPTASELEHIITSKRWEPTSSGARLGYAHRLVAERALDMSLDRAVTPAMIHGHDWEPRARAAYEMRFAVDVTAVGFCMTDDGAVGASPDAFVGEKGSLEIKCPLSPAVHMGNILNPTRFREEHWIQTQGQLWVTKREWTDLVSYFQGLPMVVERITPHAEFQAKLTAALNQFLQDLNNLIALAESRGVEFPTPDPEASQAFRDWLTEEDVEAHLQALREREQVTNSERKEVTPGG